MKVVRAISLYTAAGLAVVITALLSVSLYTAAQYLVGRDRIVERLDAEGDRRAAALAASVAPYVQAYAVTEYGNLVSNEMASPNIRAIVVRDTNMGEILGAPAFVSGRVREASGAVVPFDDGDDAHAALVADCEMRHDAVLVPPGTSAVGSLSVCMSDGAVQAQLGRLVRDSALIGLVTTVPIVVIVLLTLHLLVLRPVRAAADVVAARDATGLPERRVPVLGAREVRALSSLINEMIGLTRASRMELEVQRDALLHGKARLTEILRLNQDILAAAGEGIYGVDGDGVITFINAAACSVLGWSGDDLVGRHAHRTFHHHRADGSVYPADECPTCAAFRDGRSSRTEGEVFWRRDGSRVMVEYVTTPMVDGEGARRGAVVVFRDVTEMRQQQARLKKLSQAVEQSPVSVVITDRDGNIEYVNRTFEKTTGYTFAEVKGSNPRLLQSDLTTPEEYRELWQTILSGETWSGEFRNRRRDGTLFWELATIAPVIGDDGVIESFLGVKEEITERKAMEEALRRSNEELEQFAYAASHDLRQPLRMITSYTQLVDRKFADDLPERAREFLGYVRDGALRMDQMLVALLEYSRVGRTGEPIAPVDSGELVAEAMRFLAPAMAERKARVRMPETWPVIRASRNEGVRLFQNLIGNALKYCPPDRRPEITIAVEDRSEGWEFAVTDNGIGIHANQIPRLFKVFQRLHTAEEYEGTGIGLAVCRRIMERHGGHIRAESAGEGLGCTFRVLFPRSSGV